MPQGKYYIVEKEAPKGYKLNEEKMPFEVLEPQKSFELVITTYDGTPGKLHIKTEWENDNGEKKEKLQWCDM